jgi:ubiquitin carboxyl-terminal hydrolase 7
MIEPLKSKQSLKAAELQDGDIICFQKVVDRKGDAARNEAKPTQDS